LVVLIHFRSGHAQVLVLTDADLADIDGFLTKLAGPPFYTKSSWAFDINRYARRFAILRKEARGVGRNEAMDAASDEA
jgi:hypothetical protein